MAGGLMAAWALALTPMSARAEIVQIFPSQDATLIGRNPNNSLGGASWFTAGVTQNGDTNRALLQFDIAAVVPTNARIIGVQLTLVVVRLPGDGQTDSSFSLRRLFRSWGEGTNVPINSPGFGVPASPGDATWSHRFAGTTNTWATPGGAEGTDYAITASGYTSIGGYSAEPYLFDTTAQMVSDVQGWLDDPTTNFGWLLKTEAETDRFTARGFGSRELEDPNTSVQLIIDYAPAPQLTSLLVSNRIHLTFPVAPGGTYRVESRDSLSQTNAWSTFTNLGYQFFYNTVSVSDSLTRPRRFYRVRVD